MNAPPSREHLVVALAGQPNCGKSTLFNAVAGFRVDTGNFAGTSVGFSETLIRFEGRSIRLIDLPGTYSISSLDQTEKVARDFLLSGEVDVLINVVDSALLSRSLELTIQLMEMKAPMVVCLNMADEARHKGIEILEERFTELTGIATRQVVAVLGTGIDALFRKAIQVAETGCSPVRPVYDRDVEECVARILDRYPRELHRLLPLDERFVVLRLLELDLEFEDRAAAADPEFMAYVRTQRRLLAELHAWPEEGVLGSHRHALVLDLYEKVTVHHRKSTVGLREKLDRFITNPFGGALTVAGSLLLTFYVAVFLGDAISRLLEGPFNALRSVILSLGTGLAVTVLSGVFEGLVSGAGIVLPYLVPLLLLLALFEDTGLLPRIAFMMDGLLHRVGLHGDSVAPLILGFGCNVPAIMATRNIHDSRSRLVTMLVIPFVACSARSVVIVALAGRFLGGAWALGLYLFSGAVAAGISFLLSRSRHHRSPGVIMEVPPLRRPYPVLVARKVWFRLREFLLIGWPVLVISSVALALLTRAGMDQPVNQALAPLTVWVLGLPATVGIALFLGLFRKELTLVMLAAALGTKDFGAVLSTGQILVLVIFTMLYIPCIATLTTIWKEGGWKTCLLSAALNFGVALLLSGLAARLLALAQA